MSKLSKLLFALLAVVAMLLFGPGTAVADQANPTPEECMSDAPPAACTPPEGGGDTPGPVHDGAGDEDVVVPSSTAEAPPTCDDLPDTPLPACELPTCDDLPDTPLPACELPPCETQDDLPLCIPDCEFIAGLLGLAGCELPEGECLDLSQLPAELLDLVNHLPQEILDALPICPAEPTTGGGPPPPVVEPAGNPDPYYENCDDARARGAAPVYEGDPGYRPELDSDSDGIGCEDDAVVPAGYDNGQLAYTGVALEPLLRGAAILLSSGTLLMLFGARRRT
ncbi:MAG: Excalibur calcium-binding domain protein [Blastococcus sp.]|nr:Excalibur calcium-binding domain protein [Blastococcus sp.]